jgi:G:T-mismatch repair DNA endonuclease (very short patch repair protein)
MEKIECEICGKLYGIISPTHVKKHGLTLKEYKELYPNSSIVSGEVSKKLSENAKNNESIGFKKGVVHVNHTTWNKGLTKETSSIIKEYSEKLKKPMTEEQKEKISISKTKNIKYIYCKNCGYSKPKTNRNLCISCAQKIRASKFENPMKGKKLSEDHKIKLLSSQKLSHTKPEIKVFEAYGTLGLKYTGDRKFWVKFKNGKLKNPDFVFGDYRICVEVFGDYWHKGEDTNELINKYDEIGWRCLILWESEIKKESISSLSEIINQFINYDNYFPYYDENDIDYGQRFIAE